MKFKIAFFLVFFNFSIHLFSNSQLINKSQLQINKGVFMLKGSKTPFTGMVINGKDREFYKNGKPDGKWLNFYENGKLKSIENWKNGVLNGKHIIYSNDEVKIVEYNYTNGEESGPYLLNHDNGKPYIIGEFHNSSPSGIWKYYDRDGKLTGENDFSKRKKK